MTARPIKWIAFAVLLVAIGSAAYYVRLMFEGSLPVPQYVPLGFFNLRLYSLMMLTAAFAGYVLAQRRRAQYGFSESEIDTLFFLCVIFGLIGARMHHVLSAWSYYRENPELIVALWNGGMGFYGALVGGMVGALLWAGRARKPFLAVADFLAPAIILGQAIGRWGNFFNQEAYGVPTDLPWKMYVTPDKRLTLAEFYHPYFLYESLANLLVFFIVLYIARRTKQTGVVFGWYLILYSIGRFLLEQLRQDSSMWQGFRLNQVLALVMIATGVAVVAWGTAKSLRDGSSHDRVQNANL